MKNHHVKKGLVVAIICIIMIVSFPTTTSNEIEFPKENGPYVVFLSGWNMLGSYLFLPISFNLKYGSFNIGQLCYYKYPNGLNYTVDKENSPTFMVNGKLMNNMLEDSARINLRGFIGKGSSLAWLVIKFSYLPAARTRVFGICNEIDIIQ